MGISKESAKHAPDANAFRAVETDEGIMSTNVYCKTEAVAAVLHQP